MKGLLTLIILVFCVFSAKAQIETIVWQQCLGTDEICNSPNAVESTSSGFIFGIHLCEDGPGITNYHDGADSWIVNADSIGNILWERCYGGSNYDAPIKIIKVNDSAFYLLVNSSSTDGDLQNGRPGNFWIVKINDVGDILWENSYGGSVGGEEVRDALLIPDNGLLMMGRIYSTGGDVSTHYGSMDIWMCRIDSTGSILWEKTFGNQGRDNALKIKLTADQTVLMIGCHYEPGGMIDCPVIQEYGPDVWIVEMDLHGNILYQACYGGTGDDLGWDIIKLSDGYAFCASTNSDDIDVSGLHGPPGEPMYDDIWAVKTSIDGTIIWQKCLGGYSWESPVYLSETADSGFIIIGTTNSHDGDVSGNHTTEWNESDIWVVKLSSDGQLVWEHSFGGLGTDRFWGTHSVLKKDDYNFVIGAISNYAGDDVICDVIPDYISEAWLFEIKDCNYYAPGCPSGLSGPDTLCTVADPSTSYSVHSGYWAQGYEWKFEPENAGTIYSNDTTAEITWNQQFEGTVNVFARSYNDCGYSAWCEPLVTQVYSCLGVKEQGGEEETGGQGEEGKGGMEIWPNPASAIVDCRLAMVDFRGEVELEIYDIFGRTASATHISLPRLGEGRGGGTGGREGGWTVDVSELSSGIYFVTISENGKRIASAKMIITR